MHEARRTLVDMSRPWPSPLSRMQSLLSRIGTEGKSIRFFLWLVPGEGEDDSIQCSDLLSCDSFKMLLTSFSENLHDGYSVYKRMCSRHKKLRSTDYNLDIEYNFSLLIKITVIFCRLSKKYRVLMSVMESSPRDNWMLSGKVVISVASNEEHITFWLSLREH